MAFSNAHKKYADVLMLAEAHKAFKTRKGPSRIKITAAKKVSYTESFRGSFSSAAYVRLRNAGKEPSPAKMKRFRNTTAKLANRAIERAASSAVKKAVRKFKRAGLEIDTPETLASVAASFIALGKANDNKVSDVSLSRRQLIVGGSATVATVAVAGFPTEALAEDKGYVRAVSRGAGRYTKGKSSSIVKEIGPVGSIGIRG